MNTDKQPWEETFDKLIHGYHGAENELVTPDEFFFSIEGMKVFIRNQKALSYQEGKDGCKDFLHVLKKNNECPHGGYNFGCAVCFDAALEKARQEGRGAAVELYGALEMMWDQYCPEPDTHMCMSAGENAEEVLAKYSYLREEPLTTNEL